MLVVFQKRQRRSAFYSITRSLHYRHVFNDFIYLNTASRGNDDLGRCIESRTANSLAANPPKTTEWIAPIRAQANMATRASGTMGI